MKIPSEVQRLFHRYHADRIDTIIHETLIIFTVLEDGSVEDWQWLFATYGWETIRNWIADPQRASSLSPGGERFWTGVLLGTAHETPRWDGGNGRRLVPADALPTWWPAEDNFPLIH